jgi:integrase
MPLTDAACRNAKCPEGRARERYADSGGLYLEVQPNGAKHWRWKYRFAGKEKRLALGTYPETTLAAARRGRDDARLVLKGGADPVQARKDAKLTDSLRMGNTFESVARSWFDHWKGPRSPRHADYVLRRLELDVFPSIGAKPVSDITAPQLLAMCKKIESRGALDIARRCWQTCGQIFEYALAHGTIDRNPSKDVKPSVALKPRDKQHFARVDARELPTLLRKIEAYPGSPFTRFALQLMTLTFVRTGELIGARWEEFDLDGAEWRIPAPRMKMKTPHIVPLSTQAIELLKCLLELKGLSGLLFPGERDHDKPMSNGTILAGVPAGSSIHPRDNVRCAPASARDSALGVSRGKDEVPTREAAHAVRNASHMCGPISRCSRLAPFGYVCVPTELRRIRYATPGYHVAATRRS